MSEEQNSFKSTTVLSKPVSPEGRGGLWFPVVLATIGIGVLLSGIFAGSIGLYGDVGNITFSVGLTESGRELVRLVLFSVLLLAALRINCWRVRRPMGNVLLAALRCLAIVSLVEAIRVAQFPHGLVRVLLIIAAQYVVCLIVVLGLFVMTIREAFLFVTSCVLVLLRFGSDHKLVRGLPSEANAIFALPAVGPNHENVEKLQCF